MMPFKAATERIKMISESAVATIIIRDATYMYAILALKSNFIPTATDTIRINGGAFMYLARGVLFKQDLSA